MICQEYILHNNVRQLRLLDQEEEISQYIGDTRETLRCRSICILTRNLCNIKQYKNQLRFVAYTGGGQAIHAVWKQEKGRKMTGKCN